MLSVIEDTMFFIYDLNSNQVVAKSIKNIYSDFARNPTNPPLFCGANTVQRGLPLRITTDDDLIECVFEHPSSPNAKVDKNRHTVIFGSSCEQRLEVGTLGNREFLQMRDMTTDNDVWLPYCHTSPFNHFDPLNYAKLVSVNVRRNSEEKEFYGAAVIKLDEPLKLSNGMLVYA